MPETPRWLVEHRKLGEALKSLRRLRSNKTTPQLIQAELEEIKQGLNAERQLAQGAAVLDLFRKTNLRRALLSLTLLLSLSGTGAFFFLGYGTYLFSVASQTKAFKESVGMAAAGLVAIILSMWLIMKIRHRTILLIDFGA